jgi:DNA adenine methylase
MNITHSVQYFLHVPPQPVGVFRASTIVKRAGERAASYRLWCPRKIDLDTIAWFGEPAGMLLQNQASVPLLAVCGENIGERFVGSKGGSGVWQRIISEMPPHGTYVEPFLGRGVVGLRKRPAARNVFCDADGDAPGWRGVWRMGKTSPVESRIGDALKHLGFLRCQIDAGDLVYCDPPYPFAVRAGRRYYRHEFGEEWQHRALVAVLRSLPCRVILSGYRSALYDELLGDWRTVSIPTVLRSGRRVEEILWCNFPEPTEFHDPRWLGGGFRERERLKRKIANLARKVRSLSHTERALFAAAIA